MLEGGILAWQKAGLRLTKGKKRLSIERQVQLTVGLGVLSSIGLGLTVSRWFLAVGAFLGAGLTFAGLTGNCGLALLLEKAAWNKLDDDES